MPAKPTPRSVTSKRCTCAWLENAAAEPAVPVRFDRKLAEYHVVHRDGGYSILRHCPWCGGAAPPSRRPALFAPIPSAERRRLERLTAGITTVEDAVAKLGEPDRRDSAGLVIRPWPRGRTGGAERYPTMTFSRLSKVAEVIVVDCGRRGVLASIVPRPLPKATRRLRS